MSKGQFLTSGAFSAKLGHTATGFRCTWADSEISILQTGFAPSYVKCSHPGNWGGMWFSVHMPCIYDESELWRKHNDLFIGQINDSRAFFQKNHLKLPNSLARCRNTSCMQAYWTACRLACEAVWASGNPELLQWMLSHWQGCGFRNTYEPQVAPNRSIKGHNNN
jgi:hypothetical protein